MCSCFCCVDCGGCDDYGGCADFDDQWTGHPIPTGIKKKTICASGEFPYIENIERDAIWE